MYSIYALIDPRDWSVHYVGMTDNVYARFQQHIKLQSNNEQKNGWIQSLKDADVMVFIKTLETTEDLEVAMQREAYWIRHYMHLKSPLTNRYLPTSLSAAIITTRETIKKPVPNKPKKIKRDPRFIVHRAPIQHTGTLEDVITLLRDNPTMKYAEIAEKTGYTAGGISRICMKYVPERFKSQSGQ